MSCKIVGWLVGLRMAKFLDFKKIRNDKKKKSRINPEMVNTKVLPKNPFVVIDFQKYYIYETIFRRIYSN